MKRIVHIAPIAPYNIGWGYQENLLPKYQKELGYEVTLIITNTQNETNGMISETEEVDYIMEDGVRLIRKRIKHYGNRLIDFMFSNLQVFPFLIEIRPDLVFFHGLVSISILDVIKYKKKYNPQCVIVQDNHHDPNIGRKTDSLLGKIMRAFYVCLNHYSQKYVSKVYGVTPWREQYAKDYFRIDSAKTDVLIMGADDQKVDLEHRQSIRNLLRTKLGIENNEFLVCSGGKIDAAKNIHLLIKACKDIQDVKLLVFGKVSDEFKEEFEECAKDCNNLINVGWIPGDQVYSYFFASDLVVFPGQHSVLWEQACASKVPCVFKHYEGMEHVNNGGNSILLDSISVESLCATIESLKFTDLYTKIKRVAESDKTDIYMYSNIAKKSVEMIENN